MRILICNWKDRAHPRAGGAEVWTHGVASALVTAGHTVTLACASVPGRPSVEHDDGVEIVRGGRERTGVHAHARRLYESRPGRFDLVLDEVNTRPFGAVRWARDSRVVAMAHQVAREVWFYETPLPVALVGRYVLEPRWLRRYRDVLTFTDSESSRCSLEAYGLRHVRPLPMGSDLGVPRSVPKVRVPTFAWVGRLVPSKRPDHAVEAFRRAACSLGAVRLRIVGSGPMETALRRRAGGGVEILGRIPHHARDHVVGSAHALLVTSVREGWGLVVSEAAALGTPSIAYAVPGLVDSVAACGGRLVDPDPEALAAAMVDAVARRSLPAPTGHGTVPWSTVATALLDQVAAAESGRA
ncbi:MAG: glycosyltransferase family 4 protein [Acidimicrobiia bacterium]|nr:glycosyltransferase family 4 protein [Acidimicrobiia bacterium]